VKITINNYNKTYSAEVDDDMDVESIADIFKGLLVSMGYHPCNVDELFNTEYKWFTQAEIDNNRQGHLKRDIQPFMNAFKKGYEAKELQEQMYNQDLQEKSYQEKLNKIKDNE
jgi:hypothetical protein